jgi:cytosine/adenosine deaminase-related metal-dependent hydrolase
LIAESRKTLLTAAWLAPISGPLVRDGAVVFENGRIAAVGNAARLRNLHPQAKIHDASSSIILPGLINAHTHLELSDCRCGPPPTDGFAGWLVGMLQRTRITPEEMEQAVTLAVTTGAQQCRRFGVTTVGDISRQCRLTRSLLKNHPLRVVSYGEVQAMAQRRGLLEERVTIAADQSAAGPRLRVGITPHAPYSVEPQGYRRCLEIAANQRLPLATHLAETADEATFLADHRGPLRDLWDAWLTWDDSVPCFAGGPIRYAQSLGLLDYPTLLAHVNYCDDNEMAILVSGKASVVYCPRTHAYFAHPPHRWRQMLQRGINVAVGTDSCASSPDLNLVDELRLLHRLAPEVTPKELWELITMRAAIALEAQSNIGSLQPGKLADAVIFPVTSNDPLREILESPLQPKEVWLDGQCI